METTTMSKSVRRPRRITRRGATVVEFALAAPIFFLFLMAAFEFGWLNVLRHTAAKLRREDYLLDSAHHGCARLRPDGPVVGRSVLRASRRGRCRAARG